MSVVGLCPHNKRKYDCKPCGGGAWCTHGIIKRICKDCNARGRCEHDKDKKYCKVCGGRSALCKTPLCEMRAINWKYKAHCLRCFVHLFPDEPTVRNCKTKETTVTSSLKAKYQDKTWIYNRRIECGCSRRRPNLFLDMGSPIVIVEVDENKHDEYDCTCEDRRLMDISQDLNHRHIVMIRFNPDGYVDPEQGRIPTPWTCTKQGVSMIKKKWKKRGM